MLYKKQFGEYVVIICAYMSDGISKITAIEIVETKSRSVAFKLGYIMNQKAWLSCSSLGSNFSQTKQLVSALSEAVDLFDDDEFTERQLTLLGYKKGESK